MQVQQEVEKFESFFVGPPTVELMFRAFDIGNATVSVTIKVRAHVSKNDVWHSWLGRSYPIRG